VLDISSVKVLTPFLKESSKEKLFTLNEQKQQKSNPKGQKSLKKPPPFHSFLLGRPPYLFFKWRQ